MSDYPRHEHIFWIARKFRDIFGIRPDHNGSENFHDFFGCWPYNDNDVKRERRDRWRWAVKQLAWFSADAFFLLMQMKDADMHRTWR